MTSDNTSGDWLILRTAGRSTLKVADRLSEAGFEVWSPREEKVYRIARSTVKRKVTMPMMASYVFARADRLVDLLDLASREDFSVMLHDGRVPVIADRHFRALRRIEAKRAPKRKADRVFAEGIEVRVKAEGGSFTGMKGVVQWSDARSTLVCIDNRLDVRIPTSFLDENTVASAYSAVSKAA